MKSEYHVDNRGLNWRQVKDRIGKASEELHVGYDLLYAYMFQAAMVFVQTRTMMGCRVVFLVVHYGNYDNDQNVMECGRLVNGYMIVYSTVSNTTHMTNCLYTYIGDTDDDANKYFDQLVNTLKAEVTETKNNS